MTFNLEDLNEEEKFALLFGIMAGDGCLSLVKGRKKFISITGSLDGDLPFFKEIISPILRKFRGKDTNIKFKKNCRAIEFNFIDNRLFDFISSAGFPIGKKGPNLVIPEIFYEKNLLKYIIQGFFATDGSLVLTRNPNKFYPRLESQTIHKNLIKQIHSYLTTLELKGHFYECKWNKQDLRWKIVQKRYKFQFNGKNNLILFNDNIGFVNPKHKKRFLEFLKYSKKYDDNIKGIPPSQVAPISKRINSKFFI